MNAGIYSNRGEDVPLGMECALPYLAKYTLPRVKDLIQSVRDAYAGPAVAFGGAPRPAPI
jgi:hypothetical protein